MTDRLKDIRERHERWIAAPGVSRGQTEDSRTILELIAELSIAKTDFDETIKDYQQAIKNAQDGEASLLSELERVNLELSARERDALVAEWKSNER